MRILRKIKSRILRILQSGSYPNGHFYSPVPDLKSVVCGERRIFQRPGSLGDIELFRGRQFDFFQRSLPLYHNYPFSLKKSPKYRYYYGNPYFNVTDSLSLFFLLHEYKPARIIEVGSGFSSAMMLDTCELELKYKPKMIFIDPFTERLKSLLSAVDNSNYTIMESPVQDVELDVFRQLKQGDLLFIDSSHISKVGSDVNYLFFQVLPILSAGVIIHFHDICYPFEYPKDWIMDGIFWNEAYLLRAFLMNNKDYELLLFNHYITDEFRGWFELNMPLFTSGGSLYIIKK